MTAKAMLFHSLYETGARNELIVLCLFVEERILALKTMSLLPKKVEIR